MKTKKELQERINQLVAENKLWEQETNRWRDMYREYDEMIEGDLEESKDKVAKIMAEIETMKSKMKGY